MLQRPIYAIPPGIIEHDGFYMRLYTGYRISRPPIPTLAQGDLFLGAGVAFGASFGGVIAPNLVLFGEFLGYGFPILATKPPDNHRPCLVWTRPSLVLGQELPTT